MSGTRESAVTAIRGRLRERLKHNENYLAQSMTTRLYASSLSYGEEKSREWLAGEEATIQTENEWITVTLKELGAK